MSFTFQHSRKFIILALLLFIGCFIHFRANSVHKSRSDSLDRIIGSHQTTDCHAGVAKLVYYNGFDTLTCSGQVYQPNTGQLILLTAAHCADSMMSGTTKVTFGCADDKFACEIDVGRWKFANRDWSNFVNTDKLQNNDLAIARMVRCVPNLTLLKRTSEISSVPVTKGMDVKAYGYGETFWSSGLRQPPHHLHAAKFYVEDAHNNPDSAPNVHDMILLRSDAGSSTCDGDSGGPLVAESKDGKVERVVGICSFGDTVNNHCIQGGNSYYTPLAPHYKWLMNETEVIFPNQQSWVQWFKGHMFRWIKHGMVILVVWCVLLIKWNSNVVSTVSPVAAQQVYGARLV